MERIYNNILKTLGFLALIFIVASCEEEEVPVPQIADMNVASAFQLDFVTMQGSNFDQVQFVFVGNRQAPFELEGNSLTFQVPLSAKPGLNTVTLAMVGNVRVTTELEVKVKPIPIINTITPTAAPAGANVTITGNALSEATTVLVGGVEATIVSAQNDELVFTVPEGLPMNAPAVITLSAPAGDTHSSSTFYVGENLLLNGELEAGDGDNFTNWGKWNGAAGMTATTNDAYTGRALRAVGDGRAAWRTQFVSDPVPTTEGVEYTVIMWIRGEGPGDGGNVRFSTNPNAQYSGNYNISSEWQQISWTFTANAPETRVVLDMGAVQDAVYFVDNITLVATGYAGPQNLLANSSFEDGLTDWELLNGTIEITSAEAHTGSNAIQVTPAGAKPWNTQLAAAGVPLTFGGTYEIKLWAKAAGPDGVMRVSVSRWNGQGADYFYGADIQVTEEWAEYSWTFTVGKDLETHQVVLDMGAGTQVLYIDDVTLMEVQ